MIVKKNKAIFLDRDGVLNHVNIKKGRPFPPNDISQFRLLPGVEEAIGLLRQFDYYLIVITNQPDVKRGTQRLINIEKISCISYEIFFVEFNRFQDLYIANILKLYIQEVRNFRSNERDGRIP